MKRAVREDKKLVIEILAKAFDDNQSVNYIVCQDNKREQRIHTLMDYSFEVCFRFGEVWLSEDRKACALALYPHQKKTTLASVWLDIKLILQAVGISGIRKTLDRESLIKKLKPKEQMLYLWFIGVDPLFQHQEIGSKLLAEIMINAVKNDLPVYLETSTLQNLPWYERFGLNVYGELDLTYTLYFLSNKFTK